MRRIVLCGITAGVLAAGASAQVVPGYTVEEYASVGEPVELSFDPTGVLYSGRGVPGPDLTLIHQIGIGGAPVVEFGDTPLRDPDTALYDGAGLFGAAGSVLTSGDMGNGMGGFYAIAPDETTTTFLSSSNMTNPNVLKFDSAGRLIVADNDGNGEVWAYDGSTETMLYSLPADNGSLELDGSDNIYTAAVDGTIRIHDITGALIDGAFVTGLGTGTSAPLEFGPGNALFGSDLYAVDRVSGELLRIDGAGTVDVIGTGFGAGDRVAADLEFGPDGFLYVSFSDEDRVIRIVPEPATLALLGGIGLLAIRRRR